MNNTQRFEVQVGLRQIGCVTYESTTYPEFSEGMVFIMSTSGEQVAFSLREVCGVITTPIDSQ
ncbi:MAG: hypothetical protein ACTINL_03655 [Serratia proteamaculans]